MADQRARLESLRTELKLWEKRFPHVTREDIKQDAVIGELLSAARPSVSAR